MSRATDAGPRPTLGAPVTRLRRSRSEPRITDHPARRTCSRHAGLAALLAGDHDSARRIVASLGKPGSRGWTALDPGSLLSSHATAVGLARRDGDQGALVTRGRAAQETLAAAPAELDGVSAVGELWLAAARLREIDRVARLVRESAELLRRHPDATGETATFHWYGVQAAILAGRPTAMIPHATALRAAVADPDPAVRADAGVLVDAARAWVRLLRGEVDADEVSGCARRLGEIGQRWAGARLAGEAALRAPVADAVALARVATALSTNAHRTGIAARVHNNEVYEM